METGQTRIAIAGAGTIGCYLGGCLALAGRAVTLLGRPEPMLSIAERGLRITDRDGRDARLPAGGIAPTADAGAALGAADLVLVTVKSGGTAKMAELVATHAPPGATIVSLQNGIGNAELLQSALRQRVVAGMVPFNVVLSRHPDGRMRAHRATSGRIHVAADALQAVQALDVPGMPTIAHPDMRAVACSKLVMNLNNALNALAGLPLREELSDRRWRLILADQASEALRAIKAAGLRTTRIDGVDPRLIPFVLRLPDPLFRLAARAMLAIDPAARSSMWDDLDKRRPTEIAYLQGAVLDLAAKAHLPAPVCRRVFDLIRDAEAAGRGSPGLAPTDITGNIPQS